MIKKLLEGYKGNELYMEGLKEELSSKHFVLYGDHIAVQKYKAQIEKYVDECLSIRKTILNTIDKVQDPILKRVFYLRFIKLETHEIICREVGYSTTYLSMMINKEIRYLEKLE